MRKADYRAVLDGLDLLRTLAAFDPTVIGTPPLGIDVPGSDIDIACSAPALAEFEAAVRAAYGARPGFVVEPLGDLPEPALRACFEAHGWEVELFCQTRPVHEQWGVRHFEVERRLLALVPALAEPVRVRKRAGMKTEPAFAVVLGLAGDAHVAMLELEFWSDADLEALGDRALAALDRAT